MKIVFDESGKGQMEEGLSVQPKVSEPQSPLKNEMAESGTVKETAETSAPTSHKKLFTHIAEVVVVVLVIGIGLGYYIFAGPKGKTEVFVAEPIPEQKPTTTPPKVEDFVIVQDPDGVQGSATENIATADPKIFTAPENFKTFVYKKEEGKTLVLSGTCRDSYYAVLVFSSDVDYRQNPAAARVNTAYECPSNKKFALEVSLQTFNLQDGSYYVFIADQGAGSWYNPR